MRGINNWLEAHKPAASRRAHLLCASIMWTLVGGTLMVFGIRWILESGAALSIVILAAALTVGVLKSRFVLKRAADGIGTRIIRRGDGQCLGGFLSWRLWVLVAVMVGAGRLLRATPLPLSIIGFAYTLAGTALAHASRNIWRTWVSIS